MTNNYKATDIKSLDYFEHIRKYPGMYIGSKDAKGLLHCVKEILSNSIDEYLNGAGSTITVELLKNNGIRITDDGRGIPHGKHSSGCSTLQACFGIANTGGKFDNATGQTGYNTSGGEHGTGGKAVNALSKKMIVTTSREGLKEIVEFSKGQFISHSEEEIDPSITGTSVEFYPDPTVLETVVFDIVTIRDMIQEFSFLCKGLKFIFVTEDGRTREFYSEHGLFDFMTYLNKDKNLITSPMYFEQEEDKFKLEVAIAYNSSYSSTVKLYTNNIPQEKGTHLTGFKTAWTTGLNTFARENKLLKEKETNLTGSDYEEGMVLILNFKMIDPVFKGQNKEELSSSEGRTYVQKLTSAAMKELFFTNKKDLKTIIDKALNARKARAAAKKARDAVREPKGKKDKLLNLPTKLVDAWSTKRNTCELLIVEGDSAAAGLIGARDSEYQAVFPIRGKLINLYKNTSDKVFSNQEVINIIKAIGLEMDNKSHKLVYDASKLRYGKIILAADADPDGQAIRNLLLTFFWSICPELLTKGHIYVAIPPLFRITTKKNQYIYLRDGIELEEYKTQHSGESYLVSRNKGLGEQDPEELGQCLLEPETRNVQQIMVSDYNETSKLFDVFMGTAVPPRRAYILEHSEEAEY
jgi:DNA gyrase subunit B